MARSIRVLIGTVLLLTACASSKPEIYLESNLNLISVGASKNAVLQQFAFTNSEGQNVNGLRIRAARRGGNGNLIEIGDMPLLTQDQKVITYWFIFENGRLVQWGRPAEWRAAAARYQID